MKEKDIKILWGRSGNRCAYCRVQLTQNSTSGGSAFSLGEQAHIVGDKEGSPRGQSPLTSDERDSYHNRILLCPNHHTEIDKSELDWPVERLHLLKSKHELWVTETLSETLDHVKLASQTIVSSIIDSAVENCGLEYWMAWTSYALSPEQEWTRERIQGIDEFRIRIIAAIWPSDLDEFRRSTQTLAFLLEKASRHFLKNSDLQGDVYYVDKFYKRPSNNPNYELDYDEFVKWQDECYSFIEEATKAANWFSEVVRRDINPMFFADKGMFLVSKAFYDDRAWKGQPLTYSVSEKQNLPDALFSAGSNGLS